MIHSTFHTVKSDQYLLDIIEQGTGKTLLIIGSAHYYQRIMPVSILSRFHCVFIDHRGFSSSEGRISPDDVSLSIIANDIERVCEYLQLTDVFILGHSGHAYMALEFASQTKRSVNGIILVGAAPSLSAHYQQLQMRRWDAEAPPERKQIFEENIVLLASDIAREPDRKFVHLCHRLGAMRWFDPAYNELSLWQGVVTNTLLLDKLWGDIFGSIDVEKYTSGLTQPILIIYGDSDFSIAPISSWWREVKPFQNVQYLTLPQCGHTPMLECPEAFARSVNEFLLL